MKYGLKMILSLILLGFVISNKINAQSNTQFPSTATAREVISKLFGAKWNAKTKVFDLPVAYRTDDAAFVVLEKTFRFRSRGKDIWLLVAYENSSTHDCHACRVLVSQIYLQKSPDGRLWNLDFFQRRGFESGTYGQPGSFSLLALDRDNYGLSVSEFNMGMGYAGTYMSIYFRGNRILDLDLDGSNKSSSDFEQEPKYGYQSKISVDRNSGVLTHKRSGTDVKKNNQGVSKLISASAIFRYKFMNGRYFKL
jgi:hypothetical protein